MNMLVELHPLLARLACSFYIAVKAILRKVIKFFNMHWLQYMSGYLS